MDDLMGYVGTTLLFVVGIYVLCLLFRNLAERAIPRLTTAYVWNKIVLMFVPPVLGLVVALFATEYPYPEPIKAKSARMMFGLACGFASTWGYDFGKNLIVIWLKKKFGLTDQDLSTLSAVKKAVALPEATKEEAKEAVVKAISSRPPPPENTPPDAA